MNNFSTIYFTPLKLPCGMPFGIAWKWFYACIIKKTQTSFVYFVMAQKIRRGFRVWPRNLIQVGWGFGFPELSCLGEPCKWVGNEAFEGCWFGKCIKLSWVRGIPSALHSILHLKHKPSIVGSWTFSSIINSHRRRSRKNLRTTFSSWKVG